ncbi:MAG: VIT domain-containing protein [Polyangiales bacterium]
MNKQHEDFLDDLALIVAGDAAALERHADLLADSAEARDIRYEAEQAARAAEGAGADYVAPDDLALRVFQALDARDGAAGAADLGTADTMLQMQAQQPAKVEEISRWAPQSGSSSAPAGAAAASASANVTDAASTNSAKANSAKATRSSSSTGRSGRRGAVAAFAALGLAAAAAGALVLLDDGEVVPAAPVAIDVNAWSASVGQVLQGGEPSDQGVTLMDAEGQASVLAAGGEVPAGSTVRTDRQTRAQLALSDGTVLTLDRDTELAFLGEGRRVRLSRGQILADVEHLEEGPNAYFETPSGDIEVIGTKFLLTASEDQGSVRVTQGVVRVHAGDVTADVKVGEEALMRPGVAARVVPATNIAESVAWSELDNADDDLPTPGLGELRAHRPGEREEEERPLSLAHHSVNVRIVGNVARTEIEERFQNDSDDELEGVYSFPIPPDARIASLTLKVDGEWQEGAFVSKDRAQQIWRGVIRNATPERQRREEEFIWVEGPWRDPALLEWQQGGRFELRIFPIPAHGSREVRISYEQTIAPHGEGRRYVYPLPMDSDASTMVGNFEMDVRVAGAANAKVRGYEMNTVREGSDERLRFADEGFLPSGDVIIDYDMPDSDAALRAWTFRGDATAAPPESTREDPAVLEAQRRIHGDSRGYALFALRPQLPVSERAASSDYVIVVDSSQSMVGERYERAARLAEQITSEMDRRDRVFVVACDVECRPLDGEPRIPSVESAADIGVFLRKEEPAGASDIASSLRTAAMLARGVGAGGARPMRLVYIGDGIASVGLRNTGTLSHEVSVVAQELSFRLTTVGIGQDADARVLASMARNGGGQYVPYVPGQRSRAAAMAVLETTYGSALESATLELPPGVVAVAPAQLPVIRSGQEILVAARIEGDGAAGDVTLRGKVGGESFEASYPIRLTMSESLGNAFVPRLWAAKTIEALEDRADVDDETQVVALSKSYGVMSRSTSLLVLESEAMFRAFGVDRARPTVQWTGDEAMDYQTVGQDESGGAAASGGSGAGLGALGRLAGRATTRSARPSRQPSAMSSAPRADAADEEMDDSLAERPMPAAAPPMRRARRGPMIRMRKVWFREGRVQRDVNLERAMTEVRETEEALRLNPNSRDRHRSFVRALSRAGQLERAETAARAWLERDRLDWEALTYLSDAVGRRGDQAQALRLLSGIVDLEPDNVILHERMAGAFDRAGEEARACAHRVSLAEVERGDTRVSQDRFAAAERCLTGLRRGDVAEQVLSRLTPEMRHFVRQRPTPTSRNAESRADLLASANWTGGADLDLSIVTPQGTRISWMGGRRNVVGSNGRNRGEERLGLRRAGTGTYHVEMSRTTDDMSAPIRGSVRLKVMDETRTFEFEIPAGQATTRVGQGRVVRRWRMSR